MLGGMDAQLALAQPVMSPVPSRLRSLTLAGPAGRLEAVLNEGAPDAGFAALVCHPHPLGGGNLHNKVVYHAMKVLNEPRWGFNFPALRFNFRGAGLSEGAHDGTAETGDVVAALDWLRYEFNRPIVLVGFSFGAAMAIAACSSGEYSAGSVRALAALGLPVQSADRSYQYLLLQHLAIPKLFLSGDRDEFASTNQISDIVMSAADPKQLAFIHGSDHFFNGHMAAMQRQLAAWLKEHLQ
jgi:Predicted hydrolase of the alpha/beta superfamily